jgi:hypothetical protein
VPPSGEGTLLIELAFIGDLPLNVDDNEGLDAVILNEPTLTVDMTYLEKAKWWG